TTVPSPEVAASGEAASGHRATIVGLGGEVATSLAELVDMPDTAGRPTLPEIPMSVKHQPEEVGVAVAAEPAAPASEQAPTWDVPSIQVEEEAAVIEVTKPPSWRGGPTPAQRLRGILEAGSAPPPSTREVEKIPKPRGRAPRMVALTLLDGTT